MHDSITKTKLLKITSLSNTAYYIEPTLLRLLKPQTIFRASSKTVLPFSPNKHISHATKTTAMTSMYRYMFYVLPTFSAGNNSKLEKGGRRYWKCIRGSYRISSSGKAIKDTKVPYKYCLCCNNNKIFISLYTSCAVTEGTGR